MLEAKNITFSYDGHASVLNSANLSIKRGEVVVLTGRTGSGKTTLARCLSGFIPRNISGVFSGSILLDSTDTQELTMSQISRRVALVQQDPDSQICTLRVSDEVAFGPENYLIPPESINLLLGSSLQAVGAEYLLDRPTYSISGGEKQRVTVAALLSCQPEFLILDEPSANLDPSGILQLRKVVLDLKAKGIGILCIEHNVGAIRPVSDRFLIIEEGRISSVDVVPAPTSVPPSHVPTAPNTNQTLLCAEGITFSYTSHTAVDNVSVTLKSGEVIALMGNNGSGKTTLLNLLAGLIEPETGTIQYTGVSLNRLPREDIARRISVVFQNPNHQIFERTLLEEQNLTLGVLRLTDTEHLEVSNDLLQRAELDGFKQRNPFSLSHGQKRRLNVTSILAHRPEILLLDEPFIGQDIEGRMFITKEIHDCAWAGGAALVVTHDSTFALTQCNRSVFMDKGSILLDGTPKAVIEQLEAMGRPEFSLGVPS